MVEQNPPRFQPEEVVQSEEVVTDAQLESVFGPDFKDRVAQKLTEQGFFLRETDVPFLSESNPDRRHPGSHAVYIVDAFVNSGRDKLLVGVMKPKGNSTIHDHPFPEVYYKVEGPLDVWMDVDDMVHRVDGSLTVPKGVWHYARGTNQWSMTIILMQGAGDYPKEEHHRRRIALATSTQTG